MIAKGKACARPGRGGFTMVEVAVTALMLAIAMTTTLHVLGWVASERRAIDRRQRALLEAANLMERLTARPWEELRPEAVGASALSDATRRALPGAELTIALDPEAGAGPGSKRIALRIRWRGRSGGWEAPVRLTAWAFRRGAGR